MVVVRFIENPFCLSSHLLILALISFVPGEHNQSPFDAYLSILGELEGFIDSHDSDVCLVIGDFNVDFNRNSCLKEFFLSECDLFFSNDNIYPVYLYMKETMAMYTRGLTISYVHNLVSCVGCTNIAIWQ